MAKLFFSEKSSTNTFHCKVFPLLLTVVIRRVTLKTIEVMLNYIITIEFHEGSHFGTILLLLSYMILILRTSLFWVETAVFRDMLCIILPEIRAYFSIVKLVSCFSMMCSSCLQSVEYYSVMQEMYGLKRRASICQI